jgi:hypothetical protein
MSSAITRDGATCQLLRADAQSIDTADRASSSRFANGP